MSQVSMTIRMDKAFYVVWIERERFAREVVQRGRIPFNIVSDEAVARTQQDIDKLWAEKHIDGLFNEHLRTSYKRAV